MRYKVIEADSADHLSEVVTDFLSKGWVMVGGVSVSGHAYHNDRDDYWDTCWNYAQGMLMTQSETGAEHE